MAPNKKTSQHFLGLDLSTQSLSAILIEPASGSLEEYQVNFDRDLPAYGTRNGVIVSDDPRSAHADPRMWADALDLLLLELQRDGLAEAIGGIAVSAQQHGTVYLNDRFEERLMQLEARSPLAEQLIGLFSRPTSPIWMDQTTSAECQEINNALGGSERVSRLTGSAATERFAGPQIRRFVKTDPERYRATAHIAFISSFMTSLLHGEPAPVDAGDGFGTNLADIQTGQWHQGALDATAPGLMDRLPPLVTRDTPLGVVSPYLVKRYGFSDDALVINGSGDNPCSLVGIGLIGDIQRKAISLGTSDTYFGYMEELEPHRGAEGHIFGAADGGYMFLLCFQNGSLARERIRKDYNLTWGEFSDILTTTPPGNGGRVLLPYVLPEITPRIDAPGIRRFGGLDRRDTTGNVRAMAEAQAMSMYLHSQWTGPRAEKIVVTAGASENHGLLSVFSQVFNAEIETLEVTSSAALGAALRAAHAALNYWGMPASWGQLTRRFASPPSAGRIRPDPAATAVYRGDNGLLRVYDACERHALGLENDPNVAIARFRAAFTS